MGSAIAFLLSNFTLTFFVLGLIAAAVALARAPRPLSARTIVEAVFAYFLLFSIGFSFLYNFVMHTFFGAMAARFIGWRTARSRPRSGSRAWASRSSASSRSAAASISGSRRWSARRCSCSGRRAAISIR